MKQAYGAYIEEGTKKLLEILSSPTMNEEERSIIIDAFSAELMNGICDPNGLREYEPFLYGAVVRYNDRRISCTLNNSEASYREYDDSIKRCIHQQELFSLFKSNAWEMPAVENSSPEKCRDTLTKRQETTSISSKIIEEDNQIDELSSRARRELNTKDCDMVLSLLNDLDEDIAVCKEKRLTIPPIKNKNTKKTRKEILELRETAEQKDALHKKIFETDYKIQEIISYSQPTLEQCSSVVGLCQIQEEQLKECERSKWPIPTIRCGNISEQKKIYTHFIDMLKIDSVLVAERDQLSSHKQYKTFFALCEKQKLEIDICKRNGWAIPSLQIDDPATLFNTVHAEKSKKDRVKRIRNKFILAGIIAACILALVLFCVYKYRSSRIQIPFDASRVAGENVDVIYDELDDTGFENIKRIPDTSGWGQSGEVIDVSIDGSDSFKKGTYKKPDVDVEIEYYSEDRVYVTDLLNEWRNTDYEDLKALLQDAGFKKITVEKEDTYTRNLNKLPASLMLNEKEFSDESCYLPLDAPIVISYYSYRIEIKNTNEQLIGQDYKFVMTHFRDLGFTNVQATENTKGWAKNNTIIGVSINGSTSYGEDQTFAYDDPIVIEYSSDDRVNATSFFANWQNRNGSELQTALKNNGFSNVSASETTTFDKSKNHKVAKITLDGETYTSGDCYIQNSIPIIIEYYNLSIEIGGDASSFIDEQYGDVVNSLKDKGFVNIQLKRANNLTTGWIKDSGSVKSISINGNEEFTAGDKFAYTDQVVIIVNTFKNKGCEDITLVAE